MWVLCTTTVAPNNPPNMSTMNGVVLFELKAPYTPRLNEVTFRSGYDLPDDVKLPNNFDPSNPDHMQLLQKQKDKIQMQKLMYGPSPEPECEIRDNLTYISHYTYVNNKEKVALDVTKYQNMKEGTPPLSYLSELALDADMFNELNTALEMINKKQDKLSDPEKKCLVQLKQIAFEFCNNIQASKIYYYENNGASDETTDQGVKNSRNKLITFVNEHQKLLCRIGTRLKEKDGTYYRYLLKRLFKLNACEEAQCCCVQ